MTQKSEQFIDIILYRPEDLVIVGTGSQAADMRKFLLEYLSLKTDHIASYSSFESPLDRGLYLVCATPQQEVFNILVRRGIPEDSILIWADIRSEITRLAKEVIDRRLGIDTVCRASTIMPLFELFNASGVEFRKLLDVSIVWDDVYLERLELTSSIYLSLFTYKAKTQVRRLRKLLFPSQGRCGGNSIMKVFHSHSCRLFNVDHEGFDLVIYRMLRFYKRGMLSDKPLIAILGLMLDEFDCLGGNPLCFLMPYLKDIPFYDYYLLKVNRPLEDHCDSIINRNFHYSDYDYIKERTTAVDWNEMTKDEWSDLPLIEKVKWYIDKVNTEIERGYSSCVSVVNTALMDLSVGLNQIFREMQWPEVTDVPHVNTLPKDRIYSMEERIALYSKEYREIGISLPPKNK